LIRLAILSLWVVAALLALAAALFVLPARAEEPEFAPWTPPPKAEEGHVLVPDPRFLGVYRVSFYCRCKKCCGRWSRYGKTASGLPARGNIAAVDPRVIALGDQIRVQGIGLLRCEDTGRAIKGRRLDVLVPTHWQARKLGVKHLKVWGIEEEKP
jgi:3D (Asp-Asp-Asp) domain-containing protein